MLSSHRPFQRKSQLDTMHAIAHDPFPPLTNLPERFSEILERALAKDPRQRYQHAGDFGLDLERVPRVAAGPHSTTSQVRPRRWRRWALLATAAILLTAAIALFIRPLPQRAVREPLQFTFEPPEDATLMRIGREAAMSPDGKRIAFAAQEAS